MARWSLLLGSFLVLGAACSSDEDDGNASGDGDGNGDNGDGMLFGRAGSGSSLETNPFANCAEESFATEAEPLDIYIMFDQSCSMSCPPEETGAGLCCMGGPRPRIDQVRDAVTQFLNSPDSAGIGVGIGYFGYFPSGLTSCAPNDYSNAAVPIGPLPDNARALIRSLNSVSPTGETPTGAALRGACSYASQWKRSSGKGVAVLMVTDGVPEAPVSAGCNPTIQDASMAAEECAANEGIATYVLGVGKNLDNLNELAEAGGTGQAYLVGGGQNVTAAVLEALQQIRESASVPCDFTVPPPPSGSQLDPAKVNVSFSDANGDSYLIPGVGSPGACGPEGGWHYTDASQSALRLCDASCDRVTAALIGASIRGRSAQINLIYGCATEGITQ